MPFSVKCGSCGKQLWFDDGEAGAQSHCRYCDRLLQLPQLASSGTAPQVAAPSGNPFADWHGAPGAAAPDSDNPYAAAEIFSAPRKKGMYGSLKAPLASRTSRFVGHLIDSFAMLAFVFAVAMAVSFAFGEFAAAHFDDAIAYGSIICFGIFQSALIAKRGQSLGKIALGMQIANLYDDEIPEFTRCVILRYWGMLALGCVPLLSLIDAVCIFGQERRCLHDQIAGTRVISLRG